MKKLIMLVAMLVSFSVSAQDICVQDEKPHYYVAEGTTKTPLTNELKASLTPQQQVEWVNTFRTFGIVSIIHENLAACDQALELLVAQRNIPKKDPIHAVQSLSYQGRCLPATLCP